MAEQTIKTYTTKGFKNEGVIGSTPVDRLSENGGKGITPEVMIETSKDLKSGVEKVVGSPVKGDGVVGNGMSDTKPVDGLKGNGKSAGMIGANNANRA